MGYISVDRSELVGYSNNYKTSREAFALSCADIKTQLEAFVTMESFKGNSAVNSKSYVEQVEKVLVEAIDKVASVFYYQQLVLLNDFTEIVDGAEVVRADEGVLLELNRNLNEYFLDFCENSGKIEASVGVLRATCPEYEFTKPSNVSAVNDLKRLVGATGYNGSSLETDSGKINKQWMDMAEYDRAHFSDLADAQFNSMCDKIELILTTCEQSSADTNLKDAIMGFNTNISTVLQGLIADLQEASGMLEPEAQYSQYLIEKYKSELMVDDGSGNWVYNFEKLNEIMKREPSEVTYEQYMAMIEMFNSFQETSDMEQFIGFSYEYKSDDYSASYELSPVFQEMSKLYSEKAQTDIDNVENNDWFVSQGNAQKEDILEQMSRSALLARLSEVAAKVYTTLNSPRPEYWGDGDLFLPVTIKEGDNNYHDYHATYFNNFSQYPYIDFSSTPIDIYGLRNTDNSDAVIDQDVIKQLEGQIKTTGDVIVDTAAGEVIDYGIGVLSETLGAITYIWKGAKLIIEIDEANQNKNSINNSISAVEFANLAKVACVNMQFSIVDHQFYLDDAYIDEAALQLKLNYYNKETGSDLTINDIKTGFGATIAGGETPEFTTFSEWWEQDNYIDYARDYDQQIQNKVSAFGGIEISQYANQPDSYLVNGVPLDLVKNLQESLDNANIDLFSLDQQELTPEVIQAADDILKYQESH